MSRRVLPPIVSPSAAASPSCNTMVTAKKTKATRPIWPLASTLSAKSVSSASDNAPGCGRSASYEHTKKQAAQPLAADPIDEHVHRPENGSGDRADDPRRVGDEKLQSGDRGDGGQPRCRYQARRRSCANRSPTCRIPFQRLRATTRLARPSLVPDRPLRVPATCKPRAR